MFLSPLIAAVILAAASHPPGTTSAQAPDCRQDFSELVRDMPGSDAAVRLAWTPPTYVDADSGAMPGLAASELEPAQPPHGRRPCPG